SHAVAVDVWCRVRLGLACPCPRSPHPASTAWPFRSLRGHRMLHRILPIPHASGEANTNPGVQFRDHRLIGYAASWQILPHSLTCNDTAFNTAPVDFAPAP